MEPKERERERKYLSPSQWEEMKKKTYIQSGPYKNHSGLSSKVKNGIARENGTFQGSIVLHRKSKVMSRMGKSGRFQEDAKFSHGREI
jgi:hypothetical protein